MLGINKNQYDENIKNPPSDDSYPMISILFAKNNQVSVNALSLTILDLINKDQIKCDVDLDDSFLRVSAFNQQTLKCSGWFCP